MKYFSSAYWQQRDPEKLIGLLLRFGVLISAFVAFIGGIVYLKHQATIPDYTIFTGAKPQYRHLPGILNGVMQMDGAAIIQLGVVILIATPIIRIAFSAFAFAVEKDWRYVTITLVVLAIIFFGMFSGLGG
jgi:uncharacterized membrane protein